MTSFIDPRTRPVPSGNTAGASITTDPDEVADLHTFCREGHLYEIERWIQAGCPLQLDEGDSVRGRRRSSALEIALEAGNHALTLLLLSNGYDPNRERYSPLDIALRARRFDLVDLLLEWGADPHEADPEYLFGTYRSALFERFRTLGVDLTAYHALADALAHHTSNKPLFGFARRHRKRDPKIQTELDIALGYHARKGNERGVALCLWAGADPHRPVPDLRYTSGSDDEDESVGSTAVEEACRYGNIEVLERLGPDPELDDFDELYRAASSGAVVDYLARIALPKDPGAVIRHQLWWVTFDRTFGRWGSWESGTWRSRETLKRLFELGLRWEKSLKEEIAQVRSWMRSTSDETFVEAMKLLATDDYCAPDILYELARTPAMRRRMKEVGFIPPDPDEQTRSRRAPSRPTRSRQVLKKFGVELPKPPERERWIPRTVRIGSRQPDTREIRMDRAALFERVWSDPISKLAKEWGSSDRGLSKACGRLKIPTPPRGYWAKLRAGKRVRRPRLPKLPEGQAEEIVVWAPK